MIYFTADTHFYHSNVIRLCSRPFETIEEMNRALVQNWNAYVTNMDEIYILGDFAHKGTPQEVNSILKKLKGKKYLIRGNHDRFIDSPGFDANAFKWIKDYHVLHHNKQKFVLFHYPILEWDGFFGNSIHLHGHVHNAAKTLTQEARLGVLGRNAINVGVDTNNYFPVSIDMIFSTVESEHVCSLPVQV